MMKSFFGITITNSANLYHFNLYSQKCFSTMAKLIDGKAFAADILVELKKEVQEYTAAGNRAPQLTAILVGEDPASKTYIHKKMQAAKVVGIESVTHKFPVDAMEHDVLDLIKHLNNDDDVDGILVQLPLPDQIGKRTVCNAVRWDKDVDGFNEVNMGRMCLDMKSIIPCTALGIKELLQRSCIETVGKNAVIIGRSKIVGLPTALLLNSDRKHGTKGMDATVTICHRFTPQDVLIRHCQAADIVISATGTPGLIKSNMIKKGACVIDVGITKVRDENGKSRMVGDVDFEGVREIAGYITPVPGGVGPMTVSMLMRNTITAAKMRMEGKNYKEECRNNNELK